MVPSAEGERRVQVLIKNQLSDLEQLQSWLQLDPVLVNEIRHRLIRIAFGSYRVGLATERSK